MLIERSMQPDWLSNAYAVADREGGTALFVDSGADLGPLVAAVEGWGATPAAILRTHSHHDHVVHEHGAVGLEDEQPDGLGEDGVQPSRVANLAAGDEQAHTRNLLALSDR